MALATQCPHCHTTFRVANDQLKLHAGIVRCGACQQTFNGIEHLLAPATTPSAAAAPVISNSQAAAPEKKISAAVETAAPRAAIAPDSVSSASPVEKQTEPVVPPAPAITDADAHEPDPEPDPEPAPPLIPAPPASVPVIAPDSIPDVLLMPRNGKNEPGISPDEHDKLDFFLDIEGDWDVGKRQVPDPLLQPPEESEPEITRAAETAENYAISDVPEDDITSASEMPGFVLAHQQNKKKRRVLTIVLSFASLMLLFALLAQFAYVFRNQLAANYPVSKPYLQQACNLLRCKIELQSQIDTLTIEGNELQAMPSTSGNLFSLAVQFRNHSNFAQNWPALELSLNDTKDRPVLRRIFTASEYLSDKADLNKGLLANSEQNIKLYFELNKVKAAGYHVEIFYP